MRVKTKVTGTRIIVAEKNPGDLQGIQLEPITETYLEESTGRRIWKECSWQIILFAWTIVVTCIAYHLSFYKLTMLLCFSNGGTFTNLMNRILKIKSE